MPVKKGKGCVADVMKEWKDGKLHSGKDGKVVTDQDQAVAIALSMCGKSKGKNYVEQASELLKQVKEMPQKSPDEFDLEEMPRGRMMSTSFMPGEKPVLSARFEEKCGKRYKEGSQEYTDCVEGCKKRVPMAIGYPTPTFSEEDTKMALSQLRKLRADVSHLIMMMESEMMAGNEVEVEAWMEAKITLAADYMAAVHDYAMYGPGLEVEPKEEEEEEEDYGSANDRMTKLKLFGFKEGKH
jgi:hypothetical protein